MMREFFCFDDHRISRLYPKSGPGNTHRRMSDGGCCWFEFERPFRCIVRKSQMADILWGTLGLDCLISDRVLNIFRSEGITGFAVQRADARLMFPHDPKEAVFWTLSVTGWGGVARSESGMRRLDEPSMPDRFVYTPASDPAMIIDESQWDGSDFFMVWPMPAYRWVTSRVADIVARYKLKHVRLIPPAEMTVLTESGNKNGIGFTPEGLRHYLPEPRARKIGESLGIY